MTNDICSCGDTLGDVDPRCPVHFPSRAYSKSVEKIQASPAYRAGQASRQQEIDQLTNRVNGLDERLGALMQELDASKRESSDRFVENRRLQATLDTLTQELEAERAENAKFTDSFNAVVDAWKQAARETETQLGEAEQARDRLQAVLNQFLCVQGTIIPVLNDEYVEVSWIRQAASEALKGVADPPAQESA